MNKDQNLVPILILMSLQLLTTQSHPTLGFTSSTRCISGTVGWFTKLIINACTNTIFFFFWWIMNCEFFTKFSSFPGFHLIITVVPPLAFYLSFPKYKIPYADVWMGFSFTFLTRRSQLKNINKKKLYKLSYKTLNFNCLIYILKKIAIWRIFYGVSNWFKKE